MSSPFAPILSPLSTSRPTATSPLPPPPVIHRPASPAYITPSASSPSSGLTSGKPRRPSNSQPRLRARGHSSVDPSQIPTHEAGMTSIRQFLKGRSSYDVFPVSFRLIVLDNKLMVKKALGVMWQNGVISAPLWNSETSRFDGMLTVSDIIHLIQYYYYTQTYEGAATDVEHFRLEHVRDIERELHVPPPPLQSVHPLKPLFEASRQLQQTHARRLPLIDVDDQTGGDVVLSVLTQYRVLKFIAVNCPITYSLTRSLRACNIGTYVSSEDARPPGPISPYWPIATATLDTTVFDVVHMFSERGISAVPIVDEAGMVVNLYETVDVITLVRLGTYTSLDLTIAEALMRRSADFPGVVTCTPNDSLANLFQLIRKRRLHRLVVVAGDEGYEGRRKGSLVGIISLSDIMGYVISEDVGAEGMGLGLSAQKGDKSQSTTWGATLNETSEAEADAWSRDGAASSSTTPPFPPPIPLPEIDASQD
uniref:Snf4 n=1 Tax=Phaffia rhodozyma TaxID=264483 RepID=A0A1C9UL09_PHARH|nr:Snf4 [Phaffia rhodozyma]